jgi:hypothetical protein
MKSKETNKKGGRKQMGRSPRGRKACTINIITTLMQSGTKIGAKDITKNN